MHRLAIGIAGALLASSAVAQDGRAAGPDDGRPVEPYKYDWWLVGGWDNESRACAQGRSIYFSDLGGYDFLDEKRQAIEGRWSIREDGTLVLTPKDGSAPVTRRVANPTENRFMLIRADGKGVTYVRCEDFRMTRARNGLVPKK